jgi:hypothetical protein
MKCKDCSYWQGNKYSEWGDCFRVIGRLQPHLLSCCTTNEHGTVEKFFEVPFDPHDYKYWSLNPIWKKLYDSYKVDRLGVREYQDIKDDIIYDNEGGERLGRVKLRYFQTHKGFACEK